VGCSQLFNENTNKNNEELLLQHEIEVIQGILDSREKYRKIVQAGIAHWVKEFQEKRIEIKTIDDLRKLIEMDIELQKDDF
jgi:DNA gyrase/topoisomerase IV subunit A